MAREGMVLEEVLAVQSEARRITNLKQYQTERDDSSHSDNLPENKGSSSDDEEDKSKDTMIGRTRDEVAKALRIGSGKQFDRMKAVVTRIDELKEQGRSDDAVLYGIILNRAPSAAYDLLEVDLTELSDEDKANLKAGKVSPRLFSPVEKEKKEKTRRETSYVSAMNQLKEIESQIKGLMSNLPYVKDKKQKQKVLERVEMQVKSLQSLLPALDTPDMKGESES